MLSTTASTTLPIARRTFFESMLAVTLADMVYGEFQGIYRIHEPTDTGNVTLEQIARPKKSIYDSTPSLTLTKEEAEQFLFTGRSLARESAGAPMVQTYRFSRPKNNTTRLIYAFEALY